MVNNQEYGDIEQYIKKVNTKKGKAYLLQPANKYGIAKGILINKITPKAII